MKRKIFVLLAVGLLTSLMPAAAQSTNEPPAYRKSFKNDKEMEGFALGMSYGLRLKNIIKGAELDTDQDAVLKGFKESFTGATLPITEKEEMEILNALNEKLRVVQVEKRKLMIESNKMEGDRFFAGNKTNRNVITTASGLQYTVITRGRGASMPGPTDVVTINYRGTFIDGHEFDSSEKRGGTAEFRVDHAPAGMPEALQLMTPGAKWRLFVPSNLGYGDTGSGNPMIPPGKTLIYEVELLSFRPGAAPPPLTSDIIKVPSAEEMKKGAQIETIKAADLEKERLKESKTNK